MSIPTPHISAKEGEFAKTVLMPGDPLRSKFIAENFLENAVLVNDVRGVQGYTGTYKGCGVSVMASGMGMPSMGIYSYELYNFYGVQNIIRIGSAGAIQPELDLYDIILAMGACTNSNYAKQYDLNGTFAPIADYGLLSKCTAAAEKLKIGVTVGNFYSSDTFYDDNADTLTKWQKMGALAVEMETAALYMNAARAGKRALAICTISDCPFKGTQTTSAERQSAFTRMMNLALETAVSAEEMDLR